MVTFAEKSVIDYAFEISERNLFSLQESRYNAIELHANRLPYVNMVNIRHFNSFEEVIMFMEGYEQAMMEMRNTK